MRSPAALALLLLPSVSFAAGAPEDEYALPAFAVDAGAPGLQSAPPPPPLMEAPVVPPAPAEVAATPTPPAEPKWSRLTASVAGTLSGRKEFTAGFEVFAGAVFGTPQPVDASATAWPREVAGWVVVPGLIGGWSRVSGPVCAGSGFCGQRWTGGASVRVGHATGASEVDGHVALKRLFFGEASAQVGAVNVPPAPLTIGSRWVEGVVQLRGGVQLGTATGQRAARTALLVHLCGLVEYLAFNPVGQGVQFGVVLGVGF